MLFKELLALSSHIRIGYLTDVLKVAVIEGREADGSAVRAIGKTLKAFQLSEAEYAALLKEAIEQLNK